jgi:hypothetical protein
MVAHQSTARWEGKQRSAQCTSGRSPHWLVPPLSLVALYKQGGVYAVGHMEVDLLKSVAVPLPEREKGCTRGEFGRGMICSKHAVYKAHAPC